MLFNYEGNSKLSGIYEIRNRYTNRSYVGQAVRLKERWTGHKSSLLLNKHSNSFDITYVPIKFYTDTGSISAFVNYYFLFQKLFTQVINLGVNKIFFLS